MCHILCRKANTTNHIQRRLTSGFDGSWKASTSLMLSTTWWVLDTAVNILRPEQNGHHLADDIFKCIFLNENSELSMNSLWNVLPAHNQKHCMPPTTTACAAMMRSGYTNGSLTEFTGAVCLCWICSFYYHKLFVICSTCTSCLFLTLVCVKTVLSHIVSSSERIPR